MSATASLPSLEPTDAAAGEATSGLSGLVGVIGSIGSDSADSPLAAVVAALDGVEERLDIDLSGVTERLPEAITIIRNALPTDTLRYVEEIEDAYLGVTEFLNDSALVKQIEAGSNLEQTALALVDDVLRLFRSRLGELAGQLLGPEDFARITEALELIDKLRDDFAGNVDELLPFLSSQLAGVEPDFLVDAVAYVDAALALVGPLAESAIASQVGPARAALDSTTRELGQALQALDPADVITYGAVEVKIDLLQTGLDAAFDALEALYDAAALAAESGDLETLLEEYEYVLAELPLESVPTVDDAIGEIAVVLDDFLARLTMTLSPDELAERVVLLSTGVQESLAQSPLGQVRQILLGFLDDIRRTIEEVPTEAVQQAVTDMLRRVKQELDALGITTIRKTIADGFADADEFIQANLGDELFDEVDAALDAISAKLDEVPIAEVGEQLTDAVNEIGDVVQELEGSLASALEEVRALLARLDEVSFRPVSDEVLEEIDALKAKLQAIKPEALSDVERLAIAAGLAVLKAIDLETMVTNELKRGFGLAADELTRGVEQVLAAWQDFRGRLGYFDPDAVMGPVTALLDEVTGTLASLNANQLVAPLFEQVDALERRLAAVSPGSVLDGLQAPYAEMMSVVHRANPDVWVQPLRLLYEQIDVLLGYIDIRPLLDTLEEKERELFAQARQAIIDGLESVTLPPPLDAFYAQLKGIMLTLTDAVFGDPDVALRSFAVQVGRDVRLSTLFAPLDQLFDRLLAALDEVPRDDLVSTMEALRTGLGLGLTALDPRNVIGRLRQALGRLAALSPVNVAPAIPRLPAMRASLAARVALAPAGNAAAGVALLARFDVVVEIASPQVSASRLRQLQAAHEQLVAALRVRIAALDVSGAQTQYARVDAQLRRLLPDFLRQSAPLTYDDIRAGLASMRPSVKAAPLDARVELFLAQLRPMEAALGPAITELFQALRETLLIMHPAALKGAVGDIYAALREKLHVLDPDELAAELRTDIYEPLLEPLLALDPAAIKVQIDALYQHALATLSGRVRAILTRVREAVDALLARVRQAVTQVLSALRAQMTAILTKLQAILGTIDTLIVDDLFGRLLRMIENLETSFGQELDRVRNGFDAMLAAIPLGGASAAAAA